MRILDMLHGMEGTSLAKFPQRAKRLYNRLLIAFGRFLAIEVPWGEQEGSIPLWKVIYANYGRLPRIAATLTKGAALCAARTEIETLASDVGEQVLANVTE